MGHMLPRGNGWGLPIPRAGSEGETLRPVDGRVLQPGCFYEEGWTGHLWKRDFG